MGGHGSGGFGSTWHSNGWQKPYAGTSSFTSALAWIRIQKSSSQQIWVPPRMKHGPHLDGLTSISISVPAGAQSTTVFRNGKSAVNVQRTVPSGFVRVKLRVRITLNVIRANWGGAGGGSGTRATTALDTAVTAQLTVTSTGTGGVHAAGIVKHAFSMVSLWKQKSYTFSVSMHTISVGGGHGPTHGPGTI